MRRLIQLFSALTALVSPLHADFALTAGVSTYSPQCQQSDVPGAPGVHPQARSGPVPALPAPRTATTGRGALLAAQGRVHEGLPRQSRSRTVEELGASFLAAVRSEIKTRTYETYESRIRNYIVPALGSKKVAHLATEDIRAFKRYLLSFKVVSNRTMAVSTILSTTGWTGKTAGNTGGLH